MVFRASQIPVLLLFLLWFSIGHVTPNNDGHNDYWQIKALNLDNLQLERMEIFDPFGKMIHILDLNGRGWDGTYNGKPMPSSDYWFRVSFKGGSVYNWHFTLKR